MDIMTRKERQLLEDFARDKGLDSYWDRWAIAERSDLPANLIPVLAKDKDWHIRIAIAERSDLPADLIPVLAKDEDWDVREAIVNNIKERFCNSINKCQEMWNHKPYEVKNVMFSDSSELKSIEVKNCKGKSATLSVENGKIKNGKHLFDVHTGEVTVN